ncbi:MAG: hypothetical protein WCG28_03115 [bacterium]
MRERLEPEKKKSIRQEKKTNYWENAIKLITPFLIFDNEAGKTVYAFEIGYMLDSSGDFLLREIMSENKTDAAFAADRISTILRFIKEGKILKEAPWFEALKNKIIGLELYLAYAEAEISPEEREKLIQEYFQKLDRELGNNRSK